MRPERPATVSDDLMISEMTWNKKSPKARRMTDLSGQRAKPLGSGEPSRLVMDRSTKGQLTRRATKLKARSPQWKKRSTAAFFFTEKSAYQKSTRGLTPSRTPMASPSNAMRANRYHCASIQRLLVSC